MAAANSISVNVMCPNKRRVLLKVAGSKILHQILEEACKKQGFSSDGYGLASHGKPLDLSLSFRLSGLPNNCNLEVISQPQTLSVQTVQIAVQLADGERPLVAAACDSTLLDVLTQAEQALDRKGSLISPEGTPDLHPVVQYMNQQFEGALVLATTTLNSIGICGGRALLRYFQKEIDPERLEGINSAVERSQQEQRNLDKVFQQKKWENIERERLEKERRKHWESVRLKEEESRLAALNSSMENGTEAESQVGELPAGSCGSRMSRLEQMLEVVDRSIERNEPLPWDMEETQGGIPVHSAGAQMEQLQFADFKFPAETKGKDLRPTEQQGHTEFYPVRGCERCIVVYRDEGKSFSAEDEVAEDFFELTPQDVQKMQRMLMEERNLLQNKALIPEKVVAERNMERKRRAWKYTVVRFRFSDKLVLQANFYSAEKVDALYKLVSDCLEDSSAKFLLNLPPAFKVENSNKKTLIEARLAPAVTLVVSSHQQRSNAGLSVKSELLQKQKSMQDARCSAKQCLSLNDSYVPYQPVVIGDDNATAGSSSVRGVGRSRAAEYSQTGSRNNTSTEGPSLPKWLKGLKK